MISLGILGGIASGKSTVSSYLVFKGACHLDGDKVAHQVLEYPEIVQQITARWGKSVLFSYNKPLLFNDQPSINRKELAKIVFNDPNELKILEDITWPLINAKLYESFSRFNQEHTKLLIIDVPLLVEIGWFNLCNKTLFIDSSLENRINRFKKRQNYENYEEAKLELNKREQRQASLDEKKKIADFIINNDNNTASLYEQLDSIWESLIQNA